jgi:transposase-like protein
MTRNKQTIEVVTVSEERRRRWSTAEKAALVPETYEPGMSVVRTMCKGAATLRFSRRFLRV